MTQRPPARKLNCLGSAPSTINSWRVDLVGSLNGAPQKIEKSGFLLSQTWDFDLAVPALARFASVSVAASRFR